MVDKETVLKWHELYMSKENMNMLQASEQLNVNYNTLRRNFKKYNLVIKRNQSNSKKYFFNQHYFDTIDDEHKAYWLGFLLTDGYISRARKHSSQKVGISIHSKDKEILEVLNKDLESNVRICEYVSNNSYTSYSPYARVSYAGDYMADKLKEYGMSSDKTYHLEVPRIRDDLIRHMIRGMFDGDGSAYLSKTNKHINEYNITSFQFTGLRNVLEFIMEELLKNKVILKRHVISQSTHSRITCDFKVTNKYSSSKFYHYLYDDATIYLKRKKDKFINIQ